MGPNILIDKSTLQSLSRREDRDEISHLFHHYEVIICRTLLLEILGDLSKETSSPDDVVQELSHKLTPLDSKVIPAWQELCAGNLLGQAVPMDGRPIIREGTPVTLADGRKIIFFDETEEMKLLRKWQVKGFTESERRFAKERREAYESQNLEAMLQTMRPVLKEKKKFKSLEEAKGFINQSLSNSDKAIQQNWLGYLLNLLQISAELTTLIYNRWLKLGMPTIGIFAPYGEYCIKAITLFVVGTVNGFVSTKNTNPIDLEYLYYLPFCQVFTTKDIFQKKMSQHLLRADQEFIPCEILKQDLARISEEHSRQLKAQAPEERTLYERYPPDLENSVTLQMWKKYMAPKRKNPFAKMTPELHKQIMEQVRPVISAITQHERKESNFNAPV